jgi:hypothetical protein
MMTGSPGIEQGELLVHDSDGSRTMGSQEARLLQGTAELARALAEAATSDEVVGTWVRLGAAALDADFVNIGIVAGGTLRTLHPDWMDSDMAERYAAMPLSMATPLTDAVTSAHTVELHLPHPSDGRYAEMIADMEGTTLTSIVAVPVIRPGLGVIGAIGAGWRSSQVLDDLMRARLETIVQACGAALERAQRGDVQRDTLEQIQRSLLPDITSSREMAVSKVYLPATTHIGFGGDWYDQIVLDDGRVALIVGDVVGHGTAAAARMTQVRTALAALIDADCHLTELVTKATQVLQRITGERDYIATAAVVVVDLDAGTVCGITAGHPPPLVVGPDGELTWLDGARSAPLGLTTEVPAPQELRFPVDSTLVMYTDGLIERRGEPITIGLARLAAAAASSAPIIDDTELDLVVSSVLEPGDARRDDVAALTVHRRR